MKMEVDKGRFREDLYYRLNVFPLRIPSLRERKKDIYAIAMSLLNKWKHLNQSSVAKISDDARKIMENHNWPGNVRELENVVQRAIILSDDGEITPDTLFFDDIASDNIIEKTASDSDTTINIKENEYNLITDVLESVRWSRKQAAKQLGISERTLRYKLSKMRDSGYEIKNGY
jgi:two-component system response regulator FlrC